MSDPSCTPSEASEELRSTLTDLFAAHDVDAAIAAALDAVESGRVPVEHLYCATLGPLLERVGARWHAGELRVWEEHLETAGIRALIEACRPHVRAAQAATRALHPGTAPATALFACPPQEAHVLSLRMLADRFGMAGWECYYLGADVPVDEIVDAALTLRVGLIVLTAATHFERLYLHDLVDGIRARTPGIRLLVGGPAFSRDHADWPPDELIDPEASPSAYA